MARRLLTAVAALAALLAGGQALADYQVPGNQDFQSFGAYHMAAPGTTRDPPTSPELHGGHAATSVLGVAGSSPGVMGDIVCATPGQFLGNVGGVIACSAPPISATDNVTIGVSGGVLQRLAIGGAVVIGAGSNTASFGNAAGLSVLGVGGASTAPPAPIVAPGSGTTALIATASSVSFGAYPYSALSGAPNFDPGANGIIVRTALNTNTARTLTNTDGTLSITNPDGVSGNPVINSTGIVASWALTTVRTFLYDPVNGSDANPGFSDVAGPYNPATQAKATIAGLKTVFPKQFNGRVFRLIIASGTYSNPDLDDLIGGATGIGTGSVIRGTATNSTAGVTAFVDSPADRAFAGATTATGCNAAGYNPTGTPTTTTLTLAKVGGGSPAFSAEPASPLMWRGRFDSATATAALRNVVTTVIAVSGANTVTFDPALPATPSTSDVLYLEMAGITYPAIHFGSIASSPNAATSVSKGLQLVGIRTTGASAIGDGYVSLVLSGIGGTMIFRSTNINIAPNYFDPVAAATITSGGGLRGEGTVIIQNNMQVNSTYLAMVGQLTMLIYGQATFRTTVIGGGLFNNANQLTTFGVGQMRIIGPEDVSCIEMQSSWLINTDTPAAMSITGCGAFPAIQPRGTGNHVQLSSSFTGSSGNSDVGLDLSLGRDSSIDLDSQPSVTGALGDVRLCDGTIVTWTQAAAGIVDPCGNQIFLSSTGTYPFQATPAAVKIPLLGGAGTTVLGVTNAGVISHLALGPELLLSSTTLQTSGVIATWPIGSERWYCADGAHGSDSNVGYSDTSEADCGAKAVATLAHLHDILPKNGNGRSVKIVIASGTYSDGLPLYGLSGYNLIGVIGTGTQANAGAVAFDGSAATDLFAGGITVPGLSSSGYNPTGTPTTTGFSLQVNGGGAPSLPAEPAAPLGWRIRFDNSTSTTALRGICAEIAQVTSSTLAFSTALASAPSTSDVFYIEKAGIITGTTSIGIGQDTFQAAVGGIDMGATSLTSGNVVFVFSGTTTFNPEGPGVIQANRIWQGNLGGPSVKMGGGLRMGGAVNNGAFGSTRWVSVTGATFASTVEILDPPGLIGISDGTVFAAGVALQGAQVSVQTPDNTDVLGQLGVGPVRVIGAGTYVGGSAGILLRGTSLAFRPVAITGVGAVPALKASGLNWIGFVGAVSGSSGNTDVGLDLTASYGSTFVLSTTPTVTGTAGDVRLCDGTIIAWATAAAGRTDSCGNTLFAPGSYPAALIDPGSNGILVRTAANVLAARTLTTSTLALGNANGVAGNPSIDLSAVTSGGTCTNCNFTWDNFGRVSLVSSGAAGLSANPPLVISSGIISLQYDNSTLVAPLGALERGHIAGDVDIPAGSNTSTIGANVVTFAKFQQITGPALLGLAAGTGNVTAITSGSSGDVMRNNGGAIGWGAIPEASVTNLVTDLAAKQPTITWPTAAQILVSAGTSSVPAGDPSFTFSTSTHALTQTGPGTLIAQYQWSDTGPVTPAGPTVMSFAVNSPLTATTGVLGSLYQWENETIRLSGTTHVTGQQLGLAYFKSPTISDASAVTVDSPFTVAIAGQPFAAGSVSFGTGFTQAKSLWVQGGLTQLDGSVAINGASTLTNTALIVGVSTEPNRDRDQFILGGGALGATGTQDDTLFDLVPVGVAVRAGVTAGIRAAERIRSVAYTGTGQSITEADGLYVEAPTATGLSLSTGIPFAFHAVGPSLVTGDFGVTGSVDLEVLGGSGPGIVLNDTFGDVRSSGSMGAGVLEWDGAGNVSTSAGHVMFKCDYYVDIPSASLSTVGKWVATSSPSLYTSTVIEYTVPNSVTAVHPFISGLLISNPIAGGITPSVQLWVTKNGTRITGYLHPVALGDSGAWSTNFAGGSSFNFNAGDTVGVQIRLDASTVLSGADFITTASFGWAQ